MNPNIKAHVLRIMEQKIRQDRRRFMQEAVLKMLDNLEHIPATERSPDRLANRATRLYEAVENELKGNKLE